METVLLAAHLPAPDLQGNAVASGSASIDLAQQFIELHGAGRAALLGQPVAQRIGLPRVAELLQQLDARWRPQGLQIELRQLVEQHLSFEAALPT